MKRVCLCVLLAVAIPAFAAKQRDWRTGKLESFTDQESSHPAQVLAGGMIINADRIIYHATVKDGSTTYVGECNLGHKHRIPQFTENGPVKYAIEHDDLYLMGDDGREMKLRLLKRRTD